MRPAERGRPCSSRSGKHNVLASFKIDDSNSAILNTTVTPKLGPAPADLHGGGDAGAALRRAAQLDRPVPGGRGHGHARRRSRVDGRLRRPRRRAGGGGPRQRHGDDADGRTHRAAGGLAAGPRRALVVRAPGQPLVGVPAALRPVPGRVGGLAPALHHAHARPAGAALVRGLAALVQPGRRVHLDAADLPAAGLPAGQDDPPGQQPPAARHRHRHDACADPGGAVLRPGRLPAGAEQPRLEHPRRRLRRRGRRRPAAERQPALREHADQPGDALRRPLRERRSDRLRPVHQRPLRVAGLERRHVRAGGVRGVHAVRGGAGLERPLGRPAGRARGRLRVRPAGDGGPVRGRLAVRQPAAGTAAGVRLGGQPVHALRAQHEHQRRAGGCACWPGSSPPCRCRGCGAG